MKGIFSCGFTRFAGRIVLVRLSMFNSTESVNKFYDMTLSKEELERKALEDYPDLQPEQRAELVAFVLIMRTEPCNSEPPSSTDSKAPTISKA